MVKTQKVFNSNNNKINIKHIVLKTNIVSFYYLKTKAIE